MADAIFDSMMVHTVDIRNRDATVVLGQQTESYPMGPDLDDLACLIDQSGKTLAESPVGALIESDAVLFVALDVAIQENAQVIWGARTFIVNGTPSRVPDPFDASGTGPIHHMEIGLKEQRWQP